MPFAVYMLRRKKLEKYCFCNASESCKIMQEPQRRATTGVYHANVADKARVFVNRNTNIGSHSIRHVNQIYLSVYSKLLHNYMSQSMYVPSNIQILFFIAYGDRYASSSIDGKCRSWTQQYQGLNQIIAQRKVRVKADASRSPKHISTQKPCICRTGTSSEKPI